MKGATVVLKKKKNIIKRGSISLCILLFVLGLFLSSSYFQVDAISFNVRLVYPENQLDGVISYFDLLMEPGSEQVVEVEIQNPTTERITVLVDLTIATTGLGGNVAYFTREGLETDSTMPFTIDEIASAPSEIEIEPEEIARLPITITMPTVERDGLLALGLTLREPVGEFEVAEDAGGMAVHNIIQMSTAIILRQNMEPWAPELILNNVWADQLDYQNTIMMNLQNIEPAFVHDMAINATVRAVGSTDVLFQEIVDGRQVAPNSNFDFGIPLHGEAYVAGDYVLRVEISSDNGDWIFEQEFTITSEQADYFNASDLFIRRIPLWWFVAGGVVLLVILILIFNRIFRRKTGKTQDQLVSDLLKDIKD